jgi:hypothetical protein
LLAYFSAAIKEDQLWADLPGNHNLEKKNPALDLSVELLIKRLPGM